MKPSLVYAIRGRHCVRKLCSFAILLGLLVTFQNCNEVEFYRPMTAIQSAGDNDHANGGGSDGGNTAGDDNSDDDNGNNPPGGNPPGGNPPGGNPPGGNPPGGNPPGGNPPGGNPPGGNPPGGDPPGGNPPGGNPPPPPSLCHVGYTPAFSSCTNSSQCCYEAGDYCGDTGIPGRQLPHTGRGTCYPRNEEDCMNEILPGPLNANPTLCSQMAPE